MSMWELSGKPINESARKSVRQKLWRPFYSLNRLQWPLKVLFCLG